MKIVNAKTESVCIDHFEALEGEAWCIAGTNHSGIEAFFRLISGEERGITFDELDLPEKLGIVSFKKQQELYESELRKDETDFLDRIDPGTPARAFLQNIENHTALIEAFAMTPCLDKGYRQLSTGQSRKLILLSQMTKGKSCLAIQTPYEGLDSQSRKELDRALSHLHKKKVTLIVFVHNLDDIPSFCTHAGMMAEGRLVLQGERERVVKYLEHEFSKGSPDFCASATDLPGLTKPDLEAPSAALVLDSAAPLNPSSGSQTELVSLKDGFAGYGGQKIFTNLTLNIREGNHTLVTGPNGCGKSTLLQVITGDHPACYQNDLRIFGIQRGTGESIWDLKKDMGIVSSELHRNYYLPGNTLNCIISGLFDSIGLYQPYTPQQEQQARQWLDRLGMAKMAPTPFRDLSYANQRLVLIARALIKIPRLLILDEPTQGLDELNRKAVLDFLEEVATEKISTLLYVSHREDEFREFFSQQIKM